ncbi:MAG: hypothetical protein PHY02_06540 [Phycisphaerae bacterium]|nr:hypothetical protein [Phycisphaerae bacterium]
MAAETKKCAWCEEVIVGNLTEFEDKFGEAILLCVDCVSQIVDGQALRCGRCGAYSDFGNNWSEPYVEGHSYPLGSCEHCCDIPDDTEGIAQPPEKCQYCGQAEATTYKDGVRLYSQTCENCQEQKRVNRR